MNDTKHSKFLSLVLRHNPKLIGITLDGAGWVPVDELLAGCAREGHELSRTDLERIVAESEKQRFAFSPDGLLIRANQGHSVEVDLQYSPQRPPATLYHGTVERFLATIRREGLQKRARHHVHLSVDTGTASAVGSRRGDAILLSIHAAEMHEQGHVFYCSANGVWLTEQVPPQYIDFPQT